MRYAVLADVHANLEALTAVLRRLQSLAVDRIISLGDTVGFNANPRECLKWLVTDGIEGVAGNHDVVAAGLMEPDDFSERARASVLWTRGQLQSEHIRYLATLPHRLVVDDAFVACHANLWDLNERINTPQRALKMFAALRERCSPHTVCFFAHTHRPSAHRLASHGVEVVTRPRVSLDPSASYLFNPGSVGESRDGDPRASFAVFDSQTKRVEFYRVRFDRRSARRKAVAEGLPQQPRWTRLRKLFRLRSRLAQRPHAVVLGLGVNGLGVVRALARKSIPVVGVYERPEDIGRYSRHCRAISFPRAEDDPEGFLRELCALGRRLGDRPVLVPTSDVHIAFMSRERESLGALFRFWLPDHEVLTLLMDKASVLEAAQRYGIGVPRTLTFWNREQLSGALDHLPLPCVVKPRVPWRPTPSGIPKVSLLRSREDVQGFIQRHPEAGPQLVFQEMIEGTDADHAFCLIHLNSRHQATGVVTGESIHRYPPNLGRTASCVTRDLPGLAAAAERFLSGERFVGLAELEFKRDRRNGGYKLFEVNPRTWNYNSLALASGVDLVYHAYMEATGHPLPTERTRGRPGRIWVNTELEAGFLWKSLQQGRRPELPWHVLSPRTVHSKVAWDDPQPALRGLVHRLRRLLEKRPGAPGEQ